MATFSHKGRREESSDSSSAKIRQAIIYPEPPWLIPRYGLRANAGGNRGRLLKISVYQDRRRLIQSIRSKRHG
jgi:hypothetical protein